MNSQCKLFRLISKVVGITEDVDSHATDWRKERFEVVTSEEFRMSSTSFFEQASTESSFTDTEALSDTWKVPERAEMGSSDREIDETREGRAFSPHRLKCNL